MKNKKDHIRSTCADLLTLISIVPALDPVPAKCIISGLIKDLLTLISIMLSKVLTDIIGKLVKLNK